MDYLWGSLATGNGDVWWTTHCPSKGDWVLAALLRRPETSTREISIHLRLQGA